MACPNPPSVDLVDFIRHIQNDVRWFVRAVGNYELWFGNDDAFPPNTIVAYLDSALLHGRTLVEFFGHTNSNHPHVRACHYLLSSFPCSNHQSAALRDWKKAANIKLAHLTANRDAGSISELIVTQVPQADGNPLNRWQLFSLWQLLQPHFEILARNSLIPNTKPKFKDLLAKADDILAECNTWKSSL